MKNIWKYVVGFFTILGGILIAFFSGKDSGRSKERRKDIDKEIKIVRDALKSNKIRKKDVQKLLKDKKKELEKLKKVKEKKVKDVGADDAAEFLKKYAKKDRRK